MAGLSNRGPKLVFVTDGGGSSTSARFGWRLDAANNRCLGRGVGTHASLEDCRRRFAGLRDDADELIDMVSFESARGLWTWRVSHEGATCAIGVRTYLRRFECRRAVTHFRAALLGSDPVDGVLRVARAEVLERYELGADAGGTAVAS